MMNAGFRHHDSAIWIMFQGIGFKHEQMVSNTSCCVGFGIISPVMKDEIIWSVLMIVFIQ